MQDGCQISIADVQKITTKKTTRRWLFWDKATSDSTTATSYSDKRSMLWCTHTA